MCDQPEMTIRLMDIIDISIDISRVITAHSLPPPPFLPPNPGLGLIFANIDITLSLLSLLSLLC